MPIFKQVSDGNYWEYTDGTAKPMWLNVLGVGHLSGREAIFDMHPSGNSTRPTGFFEAEGFAPLSIETALERNYRYITALDPLKLVNPRQLNEAEVQAFIASLPLLREPAAPEPTAP